ncbi:MAG: hypothetical protein ACRYGI_12165 [Janthinobacterium lividum]
MLLDARIPLRIVTGTAAGSCGTPGRCPAGLIEPDIWTVLVASMADRVSLSLPVEGWAAVSILQPEPEAELAHFTVTGHATGCACCVARPLLARLLSELFQQRGRGTLPLFRRVLLVISASAEDGIRRVAAGDRLVSALFRLEQQQGTN